MLVMFVDGCLLFKGRRVENLSAVLLWQAGWKLDILFRIGIPRFIEKIRQIFDTYMDFFQLLLCVLCRSIKVNQVQVDIIIKKNIYRLVWHGSCS